MEMSPEALASYASEEPANPGEAPPPEEAASMSEEDKWIDAANRTREHARAMAQAAEEAAEYAELCDACDDATLTATRELADTASEYADTADEVAETASDLVEAAAEEEPADEEEEPDEEDLDEEEEPDEEGEPEEEPEPAAEAEAESEGEGEEEPGEPSMDVDVDGAATEVDAGEADPETMALMEGYDPVRDGNPPAWVASEATWEKAKKAVDPQGKGSKYSDPWAVVAHVYEKMGGTKK